MEKASQTLVRKRNLLLIIFLLLGLVIFLGGCTGKDEVDELGIVVGVGYDKGEKEGTNKITLQLAQPKSSGGNGAEVENWTLSNEVYTIPGMIENISQISKKKSFGGATRIVIFGEDVARSGINELLDRFDRFYQFRRTIYLVMAKGEAKEILETKLRNNTLPALNILGSIESQNAYSGFPVTRIGHYLTVLGRESQNPVIPIVQKAKQGSTRIEYAAENGEELILEGAGVFGEGKLIGFLTDAEAKGFLWLDNEVKNCYVLASGPEEEQFSIWITSSKTKFSLETNEEGNVGIHYQIKARGSLGLVQGQQRVMNLKEWKKYAQGLEPYAAQAIEKDCQAAVDKSRKLSADFIGIGRKVEMKDPKYWKEIKADWQDRISDFPVSFEIKVTLDNTGLSLFSPISPQKGGKE